MAHFAGLFGHRHLRFLDRVVEGLLDGFFRFIFPFRLQELRVDGQTVDVLVAVHHDLHLAVGAVGVNRFLGQGILHLLGLVAEVLELFQLGKHGHNTAIVA